MNQFGFRKKSSTCNGNHSCSRKLPVTNRPRSFWPTRILLQNFHLQIMKTQVHQKKLSHTPNGHWILQRYRSWEGDNPSKPQRDRAKENSEDRESQFLRSKKIFAQSLYLNAPSISNCPGKSMTKRDQRRIWKTFKRWSPRVLAL